MTRRKKIGDVHRFDFGEKYQCYCQILLESDVCFFNYYSAAKDDGINHVVESGEIFRILTDDCFKSSKWIFICNMELSEERKTIYDKYNNPVGSEKYRLYRNGVFQPCSREDCFGLEPTVAWTELGLTQRLRYVFL